MGQHPLTGAVGLARIALVAARKKALYLAAFHHRGVV